MQGMTITTARAAMLGLGVLLGGCTASTGPSATTETTAGSIGEVLGVPWRGSRPRPLEESATVARLMGGPGEVAPLTPEAGDVWPVPEAPRSTLANPDAAMRGIPSYRPGELDRPSAPASRSEWQPTDPAPLPPGLRGSASAPPRSQRLPDDPAPLSSAPPLPDRNAPPPRRADGRVLTTPYGPAVTTGGTDRVQTYITPGGGTGTAVNDGNFTTMIGPDGQVQTVPRPR